MLKNIVSLSLIFALAFPVILLAGIPNASAASAVTKVEEQVSTNDVQLFTPDLTKIHLIQNVPGQKDVITGSAGAVTPLSEVQVSLVANFASIFAKKQSSVDGSFSNIILGDNLASAYYLRIVKNTKISSVVTLTNDIRKPNLLENDLNISKVYYPGQRVTANFTFSESDLTVWTNLMGLDSSFPRRFDLTKVTDNQYRLETPLLTNGLLSPKAQITVYARDAAGNVFAKTFSLIAAKTPAFTVTVKKITENSAEFSWLPVKAAQEYLVEWQSDQGGQQLVTQATSLVIANLQAGTTYAVKISPLLKSEKIATSEILVKTLGTLPVKPTIQPTISSISTSRSTVDSSVSSVKGTSTPAPAKVVPSPTPSVSLSPTESPTASPAEETTETGGWNKLLIALSILIIAAGASIGGYYAYEWLMLRGKDKDKKPPKPNSGTTTRW